MLSATTGTFDEARFVCKKLGGSLAKSSSAEENEALTKLVADHDLEGVWIAANDIEVEGLWRWADQPEDSTFLLYSNWAWGNPDNGGAGEDCAEIWKSGEWNDAPCYSKRSFVCDVSYPAKDLTFPCSLGIRRAAEGASLPTAETCRLQLPPVPNMYKPSSKPHDYDGCISYCKEKYSPGQLVEPRSTMQVQLLASNLRSIGMAGQWIGLRKESQWKGGGWRWAGSGDQLAPNEERWAAGKPGNTGECVEMRQDGSWIDVECRLQKVCACEVIA